MNRRHPRAPLRSRNPFTSTVIVDVSEPGALASSASATRPGEHDGSSAGRPRSGALAVRTLAVRPALAAASRTLRRGCLQWRPREASTARCCRWGWRSMASHRSASIASRGRPRSTRPASTGDGPRAASSWQRHSSACFTTSPRRLSTPVRSATTSSPWRASSRTFCASRRGSSWPALPFFRRRARARGAFSAPDRRRRFDCRARDGSSRTAARRSRRAGGPARPRCGQRSPSDHAGPCGADPGHPRRA